MLSVSFMDLKAVFESIPRERLRTKLYELSIDCTLLYLFSNFSNYVIISLLMFFVALRGNSIHGSVPGLPLGSPPI